MGHGALLIGGHVEQSTRARQNTDYDTQGPTLDERSVHAEIPKQAIVTCCDQSGSGQTRKARSSDMIKDRVVNVRKLAPCPHR